MHPDTKQVADHMRRFRMAILGRAVYDLTFSEMMARTSMQWLSGLPPKGQTAIETALKAGRSQADLPA